MEKIPYTLFHNSYASGNFMLIHIYVNATQSGTRFSDHALLLNIVEKLNNFTTSVSWGDLYPDLLLR